MPGTRPLLVGDAMELEGPEGMRRGWSEGGGCVIAGMLCPLCCAWPVPSVLLPGRAAGESVPAAGVPAGPVLCGAGAAGAGDQEAGPVGGSREAWAGPPAAKGTGVGGLFC